MFARRIIGPSDPSLRNGMGDPPPAEQAVVIPAGAAMLQKMFGIDPIEVARQAAELSNILKAQFDRLEAGMAAMQAELPKLTSEIARLRAELAELREESDE